jgi:hypothetical protein
MAIGSYLGQTFKVSRKMVYTLNKLSGSAGADYAIHDRAGKKARSEYLGPKLRTYSVDITLRAQDGVNPRKKRNYFIKMSEKGKAGYFVIGGKPLTKNRLKITDVSEEWDIVIKKGKLAECSITLELEEYL